MSTDHETCSGSSSPQRDRAGCHDPASARNWAAGDGLLPGDAYMEGPYLVFTEQYHLRRGYCCNSGCRHCPYR